MLPYRVHCILYGVEAIAGILEHSVQEGSWRTHSNQDGQAKLKRLLGENHSAGIWLGPRLMTRRLIIAVKPVFYGREDFCLEGESLERLPQPDISVRSL